MATVRTFDDLEVGLAETSPGRTVTEADVVAFAGLSGDFNPLHTDAVHAGRAAFGRRVVHGLLATAIASGLFTRTELSIALQPSLIAMLGVEARFLAPVFFGDTVTVLATVTELRPTRNAGRGLATIERVLLTQEGVRAQVIVTPLLLRRRDDG